MFIVQAIFSKSLIRPFLVLAHWYFSDCLGLTATIFLGQNSDFITLVLRWGTEIRTHDLKNFFCFFSRQDVQEFVPYVFQILSLLLEYHSQGDVPQPYMELFHFLLIPVLWERPGNIHALVRLLQAYISRGPQQVNYLLSNIANSF